jgi:hypothetical protein
MAERHSVAVKDTDGALKWFPVADAQRWQGTGPESGELFCVAGQWVLWDELSAGFGLPADVVDDAKALEWLTMNGFEPPAEIADLAARRRLQ